MNWIKNADRLKVIFACIWLVISVAFAVWWFVLGLENISHLASLEPERIEHWSRFRRMLIWEGGSWLFLLAIGGGALIGLIERERLRIQRIKEFFASFSHEVKTSLASLRLQAEALKDDLYKKTDSPVLDRLVADTVRLQVQLENSLFLASQDSLNLFIEAIDIKKIIERIGDQWPSLKVNYSGEGTVLGDERALYVILSNFIQNSRVHGRATEIEIKTVKLPSSRIEISIKDNGKGFSGDTTKLGELFYRPTSTSGSGLGLYISWFLVKKMNGVLMMSSQPNGFLICVNLPEAS